MKLPNAKESQETTDCRKSAKSDLVSIFEVDVHHVGVLDGFRALGVLIVLWFHFWQQTWSMPAYQTPFLRFLGITQIYPNSFRRCGYLCVDLMLLLSAFVLYLPYARSTFFGTPVDSWRTFYKKRFARIVPSYLLVVFVTFFVALFGGEYQGNTGFILKDLITHLTFTEMLFNDTYLFAKITAVVWTVCIEVAFYIVFPWLARAFRKKPLLVYAAMMLTGLAFTFGIALRVSQPRLMVNRFPTFLPVFANGMMAAHLYAAYAAKVKRKAIPSLAGTLVAAASCYAAVKLFQMCSATGTAEAQQIWQLQYRAVLSFSFAGMIIGFSVSAKPVRKIMDNRVLASIAAISYNIYLWHQWLMVRLRMSIGASSGADVANAGANAQWSLTVTALIVVFGLAALITYGFERPISGLILKKRKEIPMHVSSKTSQVCSTKIDFDLIDGKVYNVVFTGGCNGNLKAIGKLVEGMDSAQLIRTLKGNTCGNSTTSCADQLAQAVEKAVEA